MTKMAEAEHAAASIVIPMIKKLKSDISNIDGRRVGTFKDEVLDQLEKYVNCNWIFYTCDLNII